jgi:hypothetical protein
VAGHDQSSIRRRRDRKRGKTTERRHSIVGGLARERAVRSGRTTNPDHAVETSKRLYRLIEDGMTEMDDVLKDRLNTLKADRDRAKAALIRAKSHSSEAIRIDPALLEQFGRSMRENLTSGSIPFRKAYLQSLIDVIEVDDAKIRIYRQQRCARKGGLGQPERRHSGFADEY